jgi:hypothetical protein
MQSLGVPTNSPNPEILRLESLRAADLGVSLDEVEVSRTNLLGLGFATDRYPPTTVLLPFAREFLRAVSD